MRVRRRTVTVSVTEAIDREIERRSERSTDLPNNRKSERSTDLPTKEPMERITDKEATLPTNGSTDHLPKGGNEITKVASTVGVGMNNSVPADRSTPPALPASGRGTVPADRSAPPALPASGRGTVPADRSAPPALPASGRGTVTVPPKTATDIATTDYPVTAEEIAPLSPAQFMWGVPRGYSITDALMCWKTLRDSLGPEKTESIKTTRLQTMFAQHLWKVRHPELSARD